MGQKERAHRFVSRERKCILLLGTKEVSAGLKMYLPGSGRSHGIILTGILVLFVCLFFFCFSFDEQWISGLVLAVCMLISSPFLSHSTFF